MKSRRPRPRAKRTPSREWMQALISRSGIELRAEQLDRLWAFDQLLKRRNRDRDLTRLIEFEAVVIKHYVDSMYVGKLLRLPSPLLDIGTGAGFPGIPLKIMLPGLRLVLAEQRPRRVEFLRDAIRHLELRDVEVFEHKVVSRSFATPVAGVITRAVETMDKTLLRTSGCSEPGTQLVFMKGPGVEQELAATRERFGDQYRLALDRAYTLPHTSHRRRLVVFERR